MSKAGEKLLAGIFDAAAFARIDALWRKTKKPKSTKDITPYDWGYRDGMLAARDLFGTSYVVNVTKRASLPRTATPKKSKKSRKA